MRILFDARVLMNPEPSGVGQYSSVLLQELTRRLPQQWLVYQNRWSSQFGHLPELPTATAIARTHYPNKLLNLMGAWGFNPKLRQPVDLILSPHLNAIRQNNVPRLITIHDLTFVKFPHLLSRQNRLWHNWMATAAKQADHLITLSHATKDDMIKCWRINPSRISVIYPGLMPIAPIDAALTQQVLNRFKLRARAYFFFVGDIAPRKNIPNLLAAWTKVVHQSPYRDFKLVLSGKMGYRESTFHQQVSDLHLTNHLVLTGYLDDTMKTALFGEALALAYPSLYEGFGLPILEAFQLGVPVLTAAIAAMPEIAGGAALYVNPYEIDDIAQGLTTLIDHSVLRSTLVQAGKQRLRHFNWEQAATTYQELFQRFS